MIDKFSQVFCKGEGILMWFVVEFVCQGEVMVVVFCGNIGVLMVLLMLCLCKLLGVNCLVIVCLWFLCNLQGFNVMLDVGVDICVDVEDLLVYVLMGVFYVCNGLGLFCFCVGLLNVGIEEYKGCVELKQVYELIVGMFEVGSFDYIGFVEGSDLFLDWVDVIVIDGFIGNVVLKIGEGIVKLVGDFLKEVFGNFVMLKFVVFLVMILLKWL